jgi:sigma-E factor negative regulatory protein RseC
MWYFKTMITEEGIIENVHGSKATIQLKRSAACAHCESHGTCEVADEKNMHVVLTNELHARAGDRVEIGLPSHSLLKLSLVVYFLPVVALVVGAGLGNAWGPFFQATPTSGAIVGGGVGLLGTYFLMKWVNHGAKKRMEYRPRMTRIIRTEPLQPDDNKSGRTEDTFSTHSMPAPRSDRG